MPSRETKRQATNRTNSQQRIQAASDRHAADFADLAVNFDALLAMDDLENFHVGPPDDRQRIDYLPTPDEIRNACASIRGNWTRNEKRRRFVGQFVPDEAERVWQPPVIDTSHFRLAVAPASDAAR